jgi:glycosyltransferase
MNKGISIATGDIVGFINSDDFYPNSFVIEKINNFFITTGCDSCYGDLVYVDQRYRPLRYWKAGAYNPKKFYWGWMPPHPTFFVKKKIYEAYGGFNLSFGTAADYEIMLRFLLKYSISCIYIPEVLVCMRTGGVSNVSWKARFRANRNDLAAWRINGLKPYPCTTFCKPARKIFQLSALLRTSSYASGI